MQLTSPAAAKAVLRSLLWVVLLVVVGYAAFVGLVIWPRHDKARLECCQSNLRQLQVALVNYGYDWDECLPPRPAPDGDFVAFHWSAVPMEVGRSHGYHIAAPQGGPLWDYAKNACISRCPSDPDNRVNTYAAGAHSSYVWNNALAGKLLKNLPDQPLAWDRAPFHNEARNVVWTSGRCRALAEQDFQALMATQR